MLHLINGSRVVSLLRYEQETYGPDKLQRRIGILQRHVKNTLNSSTHSYMTQPKYTSRCNEWGISLLDGADRGLVASPSISNDPNA